MPMIFVIIDCFIQSFSALNVELISVKKKKTWRCQKRRDEVTRASNQVLCNVWSYDYCNMTYATE